MLRVRGCHPYRPASQLVPLTITPRLVRVRSPLLAESLLMSFPPGTEMFQFPGFALLTLYIQIKSTCLTTLLRTSRLSITQCQVGCPIRKSLDQSLLPAPQSLSQVITSFIASYCPGIHQTPFSRLIRSRRQSNATRSEVTLTMTPGSQLRRHVYVITRRSEERSCNHGQCI
jgi:hypothetical protein